MQSRTTRFILATAITAVSAMSFGQQVLNPGDANYVPQEAISGYPGTLLNFSIQNFVGYNALTTPVFTGEIASYVFADRISGNMDFAWIITNDASSSDQIDSLSVTDYTGFQTAVAQDPLGLSGSEGSYFAQRTASGKTVDFNWFNIPDAGLSAILPGETSAPQIVYTDAKAYGYGTANIKDGGVATVVTFAPQAVPEPASLTALAIGLAGLIRRRNK